MSYALGHVFSVAKCRIETNVESVATKKQTQQNIALTGLKGNKSIIKQICCLAITNNTAKNRQLHNEKDKSPFNGSLASSTPSFGSSVTRIAMSFVMASFAVSQSFKQQQQSS
jgi:hypothetical protein